MASAFDRLTPIIDLGPNTLPQRYAQRRWLLWPFWAWPVAVPALRARGLNLFQHYVLALAARGVRAPAEVGARLDLGTDLAAFIARQLVDMGYLEGNGAPTHRGQRYLEKQDDQEPEIIPGYVFHDVHTGQLWPRFVPGAPRWVDLDGERDMGKFARVKRGTVGDPRPQFCRVIWPQSSRRAPAPPSPTMVRRACRTWARHSETWSRVAGQGQMGWDGEVETLRHIGEGRVTVLARKPTPLFATTFLFVPEDVDDGGLWQTADPFGLGASTLLRQAVQELSSVGNNSLSDALSELDEAGARVTNSDVYEARRTLQVAAAASVASLLAGVQRPETLERILVQLESSRLAMEPLIERESAAAWRERQRHHTALIRRAWDAMEELFTWLTATWAQPSLSRRLGRRPDDNARLLSRIAKSLGFEDDETQDSLRRLLLVNGGQARGVLEFENRDIPAMAACALLATSERADHPLHDAAASFPGLFVFLDELKRARDPLSHHGSKAQPTLDPEEIVLQVVEACHALLPGEPSKKKETKGSAPSLGWTVAVAHRLQVRAVGDVERRYGHHIRQLPILRGELVELSRLEHELRAFTGDEGDSESIRKDLAIAGGMVLEGSLGAALAAVAPPTWINARDKDELLQIADDLIADLNVGTLEALEPILNAALMRVHRAATTGSGTTGSLAFVLLLSCRDEQDHPFRTIAAEEPHFLVRLAELIELRGHGDRAPTPKQCLDFTEKVHRICQLILEHTV